MNQVKEKDSSKEKFKMRLDIHESYREIRTYLSINKDIKTILITSAEMNEGKTTTICNLGRCYAELENVKVLLLDCDFRKRSISRFFNIENRFGIADIVFGYKKIDECIKKVDGIDILTCGSVPSNTSMLLNSQSMRETISKLREQYDYVLIDSPPVCRLNDACIITQYIDATVLVNGSKMIDSKVAKVALDKLNRVGANIIGVILNKFKSEQYDYYNYYGYSDYENKPKFNLFKRKRR